jgi:hypothetical protein
LAALHVKAHLTNEAHTDVVGFSNATFIDYIDTAQRSAGGRRSNDRTHDLGEGGASTRY